MQIRWFLLCVTRDITQESSCAISSSAWHRTCAGQALSLSICRSLALYLPLCRCLSAHLLLFCRPPPPLSFSRSLLCLCNTRSHLGHSAFLQSVVETEQDPASHAALQQVHLELLEEALLLVSSVKATLAAARQAQASTAEFWQALLGRVYDALVRVNSLLALPDFTRVISRLLAHRDSTIRMRALHLLAERLARDPAPAAADKAAARNNSLLAKLAKPLHEVVAGEDDSANEVNLPRQGPLSHE